MPKARTKYKTKYAKQLRSSKSDAKTVVEWCSLWDICRTTFYQWVETIPEFAEAYEMSDIHMKARFAKNYMAVMEGEQTGNAGMYVNAAKYVLGWDGKPEPAKEEAQEVRVLNIQIIDSRPQLQLVSDNVIDIKANNE